jgi:hypothetical protein
MSNGNETAGGKLKLSKETLKTLSVRTSMKAGYLNSAIVATHCGRTCVGCTPSHVTCAE